MNTVQYKCPQCNQYWQMMAISVMAMGLGEKAENWWYTDKDGNRIKKCPECEKSLSKIGNELREMVSSIPKTTYTNRE
jgi:hypothetical protein